MTAIDRNLWPPADTRDGYAVKIPANRLRGADFMSPQIGIIVDQQPSRARIELENGTRHWFPVGNYRHMSTKNALKWQANQNRIKQSRPATRKRPGAIDPALGVELTFPLSGGGWPD